MNLFYRVNNSRIFRREVPLWGRRFRAPSADRLLALWLFRFKRLGSSEAAALRALVGPGQTVVDVGANQGVFTLLLSDLVGPAGRVLAFEPDPRLFEALSENCRRNQLGNVELHNSALSDRGGRAVLHLSAMHSGDNRLDVAAGRGPGVEVELETLDDVLAGRHADLVKIDVQGHEPKVFAGMQKTLRSAPAPTLVFEFWPDGLRQAGHDPEKLLEDLRSIGFEIRVIRRDGEIVEVEESGFSRLHGHFGFLDLVARRNCDAESLAPLPEGL